MAITLYGTWSNRIDGGSVDLETSISDWLGDVGDRYDIHAIANRYREAVNAALPEGVTLHAEEFLGPVPDNGDGDERVDVDWDAISEAVHALDLWAIADQHKLA